MEVKIPFYNIVNMLLTGLVFIGGCIIIFPEYALGVLNNEVVQKLGVGPEIVLTVSAFAVAYEAGLIINRAGSVIVEGFLKWRKWIPFNDDYVLFNDAKKKYPIMSTLSREYALSRTGIALFLILFAFALTSCKWMIAVICFVVSVIYYFSCRKHSGKIVELMAASASAKEEKSGDQK